LKAVLDKLEKACSVWHDWVKNNFTKNPDALEQNDNRRHKSNKSVFKVTNRQEYSNNLHER